MSKILAIDDKPDNLVTLSAVLRPLIPDCKVLTALSGREGIEKAGTDQPDTILLDIKMPGMDGFEVCRRLKNDHRTRHIPVIMLTAIMKDSRDLVNGLESGADAFLSKPVDESVLAAQVRAALRIKAAEDQLRRQKEMLENMVDQRTRALKQSERRAQVLLNAAFDSAILINARGAIRAINEKGARRLNREVGALIDADLYSLLAQPFSERIKANVDRVIELNRPLSFEQDDRGRVFVNNIYPVTDENGRVVNIAIYGKDITAERVAEAEHRKLETRLQQAHKMEAIGTLAGGIAHDFNNILASVIGFTELSLEDVAPDSSVADNLQEIYVAGQRARDLVRQILTFARHREEEYKPLRVNHILAEALKMLRSSIPSSIRITHRIDSDASIMGDPTQIHQIIMNLCTNAVQAMDNDSGELVVELKQVPIDGQTAGKYGHMKPGDYLQITVADSGGGVAPEIINSIFEPYFTTKEPGVGTGMGLATVHGIVKSHGGEISVKSELGRGTTFKICLPVIKRDAEIREFKAEGLPTGTERVLFVDDELPIVKVCCSILDRLGYTTTAMTSSREALERFQSNPYDFQLVISDMTMPDMTGDVLSAEMLKIRPDMPIILCTGFSRRISDTAAAQMGVKALVKKPLSKKLLAKTVRRVLDEAAN